MRSSLPGSIRSVGRGRAEPGADPGSRGRPDVAAAPAYFKSHSQGEYVFDHGWADAWEQAGGQYYPKLLVAVPFTPVPGRRLLGSRPNELLAAIEAVTAQAELSSAHVNFLHTEDARCCAERGWLIRDGIQYQWFNRAYRSFDDFLNALSSRKRKVIRRERKAACQGLAIETLRGAEIGAAEWDAMWAFYQNTGARKWGRPYLTRDFFDRIAASIPDRLLLFLARRDGVPVAALSMLLARMHCTDAMGVRRGGALPAFRAELLPRHRVGDRSWPEVGSGWCPGRAQDRARL